MSEEVNDYKKEKKVINAITLVILLVVATLSPLGNQVPLGEWSTNLRHVYSHTNLLTGFLLIFALVAIKNGKVGTHKALMGFATVLGSGFLVMYILYRISNPEQTFNGEGTIYGVYLGILVSHIFLAIFVVRYVLLSLLYAYKEDFKQHKRVVKIAYPMWLYVSFTGYIVYAMLEYIN